MPKLKKNQEPDNHVQVNYLKILDIDLDFFLEGICYGGDARGSRRINGEKYKPWSKERVAFFLENNCRLSVRQRIRGAFFAEHHKLFHWMARIRQVEGQGNLSFRIDHIDGHADLGAGDSSIEYIFTELLFLPPEQRDFLHCYGMAQDLDPGNFLVYALACGLVTELNYIILPGGGNDVPTILYKDYDKNSQALQLKKFTKLQMTELLGDHEHLARFTPVGVESAVPFRIFPYHEFRSVGDYDLIFLAKSPTFTPVESDELIPVIMKYMDMETGDGCFRRSPSEGFTGQDIDQDAAPGSISRAM
ncbi:MAG: hypothetical protein QG657_425 [Acidobacteriota bacterium]|nr:hypothetical protein [Acidobacteriota bacterium]